MEKKCKGNYKLRNQIIPFVNVGGFFVCIFLTENENKKSPKIIMIRITHKQTKNQPSRPQY